MIARRSRAHPSWYGVAVYKQVLRRRDVFSTTVSRAPGQQLDDDNRAELDAILAYVETLFTTD
jgi:dihydrodipicolinate synthase/N-acetylneuraminate lyase